MKNQGYNLKMAGVWIYPLLAKIMTKNFLEIRASPSFWNG